MEKLANELTEVNKELLRLFGTESYQLRCKIYDISEELIRSEIALKRRIIPDFASEWNNTDEPLISDDFIAKYLNVE